MSTNLTDLSTDANVFLTAALRPLHVSPSEQFDEADESLFHTVMSDNHRVLLCLLPAIKANDTNLGLELTFSP